MVKTKYSRAYNGILNKVESIREKYGYVSKSAAFGHWYLEKRYQLNRDDIPEHIIDGFGDNGIDAYMIVGGGEEDSEAKLFFFQFKFPDTCENRKAPSQGDILKFISGVRLVYSQNTTKRKKSDAFNVMVDEITNELGIFTEIHLQIVHFGQEVSPESSGALDDFIKDFKQQNGDEIYFEDVYDREITNLYDRSLHKSGPSLKIKFHSYEEGHNVGEDVKSCICVVNAQKLVEAIGKDILTINDENIRYYEGKTAVNKGIADSAGGNMSEYFYFYNNGVTFICDKYISDSAKSILSIEGALLVNGCQTVTTLYNLARNKQLKEDVVLLMRVIKTTDYTVRMNITEYLNSQNEIKDSYLLANHATVRRLQDELKSKGYFLERQGYEYENLKDTNHKLKNLERIPLDSAIQSYVGYYNDTYASQAKSAKGSLFDKARIDFILGDITAEKVITSWESKRRIASVQTMFRRLRRNEKDTEFSKFMGIDQRDLVNNIDEYLFLNSADILLLNSVAQFDKPIGCTISSLDEKIRRSIGIARDVINSQFSQDQPAYSTKSREVFEVIRESLRRLINDENQKS